VVNSITEKKKKIEINNQTTKNVKIKNDTKLSITKIRPLIETKWKTLALDLTNDHKKTVPSLKMYKSNNLDYETTNNCYASKLSKCMPTK